MIAIFTIQRRNMDSSRRGKNCSDSFDDLAVLSEFCALTQWFFWDMTINLD